MERLALKPPLITPSASPPTSHTFFPQPYRIPDQASPTKRPRLSSAPRQFQPHTSASSSTTSLDQIDFQKAREASALRMLDVWSNLADRYSRPLDEDDIIDLNTGKVVKDRGVIRGSRHWDIGCFADDVGDEAEEGDEEEDEDDVDELDSFAPQQSIDGQALIAEVDVRNVPPVREMDPADAEDLRQFLEAERQRRETCGSEVEETESSVTESHDEEYCESERLRGSVHIENTDDSAHHERNATSGVLPSSSNTTVSNLETNRTPIQRSATVFVDSGSDDELVSYDIDEASVVYRIPKKEEAQESDSEVEFVEPPLLPLRPKPKPKAVKRRLETKSSQSPGPTHPKHTQQLQTPPLSQTSSLISSATPSDDYFVELPPESSSLPPSSPPSSHCSSLIKTPRHIQNPPGSHRPASLLEREFLLTPIPRLDLTKLSKGKPILKPKVSKNKIPLSHAHPPPEASGSRSPTMAESNGFVNREISARPKMEVVINKRAPFQHNTQYHSSPTQHTRTTTVEKAPRPIRSSEDIRQAGKGKEKVKQPKFDSPPTDHGAHEDLAQSDNSIIILSSSPSPASSRKLGPPSPRAREPEIQLSTIAPRSRRPSYERPTRTKSQAGDKPIPAPAITSKKRKRVISPSGIEISGLGGTMGLSPDRQPQNEVVRRAQTLRHVPPDTPTTENEPADAKDLVSKPRPKRKPTPMQRSRSSSRLRQSDYDSDSSSRSSPEHFPEHGHRYNRSHSHFGSMPPSDPIYYPYSQPPYPPQLYAPIPDPRAQYIITQAMHQLSALVGVPWTPPGPHHRGSTPFTPSHNRHQSRASGPMYSTPTHHQHPYPYSYDTNLSRGTLPPDYPETQSSPAVAGTSARRKSLVKRSRSRGRRVSFRIEEGIIDTIDIPSNHVGHDGDNGLERNSDEALSGRETARRKKRGKDKAKPTDEGLVEEVKPNRGRAFTRAQTPGPPIRDPSSETRSDKSSTKPPVKARGTSRSRPSQAR